VVGVTADGVGRRSPCDPGVSEHLAVTFHALEEFEAARRLGEDTLQRRRQILGDDHHGTMDSASNLAVTLYAIGEFEAARDLVSCAGNSFKI
jgi:Tetratricopeptide repeat